MEKVDGMSDEVHEQLVQHYFFITKNYEMYEKGDVDSFWYRNHEFYKQAEEYAEKHGVLHAELFFPNPLIYDYSENPDAYNELEQQYIKKNNKLKF